MTPAARNTEWIDLEPAPADLAAEAVHGLGRFPKTLPCKLFYDKRGSELFEKICELPEYYPTRTEIRILRENLRAIAEVVGPRVQLIELGSGASTKTEILLAALDAPVAYTPIDISREHLREAAERVNAAFPTLQVQAVCADYLEPFEVPAPALAPSRRVAFFPGSTIGNFHAPEARRFLCRIASLVGEGGGLLIGVDLRKRAEDLVAAYDDAQGVTAEFNLNLLHRLNREAGADFEVDRFAHRSVWNGAMGRVEMHLVSQAAQRVAVHGRVFELEEGESIRTECAYKYRVAEFADLAEGFEVRRVWTDPDRRFSVQYLEVAAGEKAAGEGDAGTGARPQVV